MHSDDATKQCNNIMYSFLYELLFKAAMICWIISKRADYGDMLDLRACWTGQNHLMTEIIGDDFKLVWLSIMQWVVAKDT